MIRLLTLRNDPKREIELDFVRSVAILLAVGWHFNHLSSENFVAKILLYPGRSIGWVGVDLFFVLSGFLIGRIIFRELEEKSSFDIKSFYLRRFFKLWPTLYLSLFGLIILSGEPILNFAPQIALHVQNYYPPSIANHLWSLAVEEHFYFFVAILITISIKLKRMEIFIPGSCLLAIIIAPVLRYFAYKSGFPPVEIQWQTQFRVDALAAGVLLGWIYVYRHQYWQSIFRFRWVFVVFSVFGVLILLYSDKTSYFGSTIGYTIAYLTCSTFMLSVYQTKVFQPNSALSRLFIGMSMTSYAMYIWHVPVAGLIGRVGPRIGITERSIEYVAVCYAISFLVAYIATVLIEQPFLKLRDKIIPRSHQRDVSKFEGKRIISVSSN